MENIDVAIADWERENGRPIQARERAAFIHAYTRGANDHMLQIKPEVTEVPVSVTVEELNEVIQKSVKKKK